MLGNTQRLGVTQHPETGADFLEDALMKAAAEAELPPYSPAEAVLGWVDLVFDFQIWRSWLGLIEIDLGRVGAEMGNTIAQFCAQLLAIIGENLRVVCAA